MATKKKENWIAGAVQHPGRCKNMGSKACPVGSPQYRLAVRFKKGGDLHRGKSGNKK